MPADTGLARERTMLRLDRVSIRYDGAIAAVEDASFDVAAGALVALLGPNGAGKTSLLKAIAGMLPFEQGAISGGDVSFEGRSLRGMHPAEITRLGISLVQDGRQCFRNLSVRENLHAAALRRRAAERERLELVCHYFPVLAGLQTRLAGHLSGGQAQMLVIAMALMGHPRLLLLDEPSLGLSPVMVGAVLDAVERLRRDLDMTIVVAEQTVPRLLRMASDVVVLSRGHVMARLKPEEAREDTLQHLYLS